MYQDQSSDPLVSLEIEITASLRDAVELAGQAHGIGDLESTVRDALLSYVGATGFSETRAEAMTRAWVAVGSSADD